MSRRRLRFITPFARIRNSVIQRLMPMADWLSPRSQFVIGFVALVLITTSLMTNPFARITIDDYQEGDIVHRTIVSPADIEGVQTSETEKETARRRAAAVAATRPVFKLYPNRADEAEQQFRQAWENLRKQFEAQPNGTELTWSGQGDQAVARAIVNHGFDVNAFERLVRLLRDASSGNTYRDEDAQYLKDEITLVNTQSGEEKVAILPPGSMITLSIAQRNLRTGILQMSDWTREERAALTSALVPLVQASVIYDEEATEQARHEAADSIIPATISLKRNQVVAREGDTVTEHMLAQFTAIRAYERAGNRFSHLIGLLFIVTALFWLVWKFTEHRSAVAALSVSARKAFVLVGSAILVQTVLMRVGYTLSAGIAEQGARGPFDDSTLWSLAIPFASAALLVALLVDTHLAFITAVTTSILAGLMSPEGLPMAIYALISCSAAIYGIGRYSERQSVTLAGLIVAVVNAFAAIALIAHSQQPLSLNKIGLGIGCAIAGGLLTSIFTAGGLPVNESFFGILTDVKLLELSNADIPVLGQLALRAPGTNQHSHAVGQLAEEACRAVGANALLTRIGALYHDIGKTAAPHMFVENQLGENPHDKLRPSQSARIIISHVTYGLRLAKEIGLPKQISDFIPEHHGTRTLHFFLRKAQAQAGPDDNVEESEFRYPGPKPQSQEAAIMMLADSCEAAARSLARPDPENIRAIVSKIVDAVVSDGQLDECNLTLREVTSIREAMISSLTAIYHARVDYPGFNPPTQTGSLPPASEAQPREELGVTYSQASEVPINRSGEVEDEAISRDQERNHVQS